jgi:hypothetical protein
MIVVMLDAVLSLLKPIEDVNYGKKTQQKLRNRSDEIIITKHKLNKYATARIRKHQEEKEKLSFYGSRRQCMLDRCHSDRPRYCCSGLDVVMDTDGDGVGRSRYPAGSGWAVSERESDESV